MQYIISFLEGIITFISPCLLPMIPVYVMYFAGGGEHSTKRVVKNALGFILGFTIVFVLLGAFAGTLGSVLKKYTVVVNIITGLVVVFFGLNYLNVFKFNIFKGNSTLNNNNLGFFSSLLFGFVFSIGWTPCVGTFLGVALMMATNKGSVVSGIIMLLLYSLGLGIPFFVSAILIEKLKTLFNFIKKHYDIINKACGIILVAFGILMATGLFGKYISFLS